MFLKRIPHSVITYIYQSPNESWLSVPSCPTGVWLEDTVAMPSSVYLRQSLFLICLFTTTLNSSSTPVALHVGIIHSSPQSMVARETQWTQIAISKIASDSVGMSAVPSPTSVGFQPLHPKVSSAIYSREEYASHRIAWVRICLAIAYTLLAMIGLFSNILVTYIILFVRRRALSNITNIFVLVLSISDMILCGFNMPVQVFYELKEINSLNSTVCRLVLTISGIPMHISCLTILLIACDRYQIIIYPLYPRMSTRCSLVLVFLVVIISTVNSLPMAIYTNVSYPLLHSHSSQDQIQDLHAYCVEKWPNMEARLIYSFVAFFLHFFIPLFLTAVLYGHIFCRLHERRFQRNSLERKRRTNKILIRIVVCFAVCWTPWNCLTLWMELHSYSVYKRSMNRSTESNTKLGYTFPREQMAGNLDSGPINSLVGNDVLNRLKREFTPEADLDYTSEFPTYGIPSLPHSTRVVDLLLRLIAMSSGCINPWLYGWLNKFLVSMTKKYWKRTVKATQWSGKIEKWFYALKEIPRLFQFDGMAQPHFTAGTPESELNDDESVKLNEENWRFGQRRKQSIYHTCYCCGAFCTCHFLLSRKSFYKRCKQEHLSYIKSLNISSHGGTSSKEPSHKDSQKHGESCERCVAKQRSGSGSRTSHSGSGKHKGSRCSADTCGLGGTGLLPASVQIVEHNIKTENGQLDSKEKECHQCGTYKRFGRRYSPRLSGSSMGTYSYLDPSTKQTSLFPSSAFTPTPRGSFLRSNEHSTDNKTEVVTPSMPTLNPFTSKDVSGVYLCPPTVWNYSTKAGSLVDGIPDEFTQSEQNEVTNKILETSCYMFPDELEVEDEDDSEGQVITLQCPQQRASVSRSKLLTLQEQSDSTSNENSVQTSFPQIQEMAHIRVVVHESELTEGEVSSSDVYLKISHEGKVSHFGNQQFMNNIDEIPFVDDVEDDRYMENLGAEQNKKVLHELMTSSPIQNRSERRRLTDEWKLKPMDKGDNDDCRIHINQTIVSPLLLPTHLLVNQRVLTSGDEDEIIPRATCTKVTKFKTETDTTEEVNVGEDVTKDATVTDTTFPHDFVFASLNKNRLHIIPEIKMVKRRFSFYPGFMQRRRDTSTKINTQNQESIKRLSVKEAKRRLSHRDLGTDVLFTADKKRKPFLKQMPLETEPCSNTITPVSTDDPSDVDDFAHISRLVALEAIRKKQALSREMSVGSGHNPSHEKSTITRSSLTPANNLSGMLK
ncbi:hypothetical protein EG68_02031 [Paragonimus skrjabini miyazakii]|uniref:G-protein coupled receptors family 1 profile domain-containing protein n=1 Tax=Paragonimus skrjabini miyazakii TaxID=59628 RepID=A0A8S9YZM0_9TREM|nr:hypothetical protein EG68_02031 [Paragonimus skrjabini miyazakii]